MNLTNNLGLPKSVTNLIDKIRAAYDSGIADYTPTSLIQPYYLARLKKEKAAELTADYSNQLNLIEGSILHSLLEGSAEDTDLKETRVYRRVGRWLIGAQFDAAIVKDGTLDDYKYTTSYKFKKNFDGSWPEVEDWEAQLNIERYILSNGGFYLKDGKEAPIKMQINCMRIIGFIKDFSLTDADRDPLYPQHPVIVREIPAWPDQRVEEYIIERCQGHNAAAGAAWFEVQPCSQKEMWAQAPKWALMKKGNKKALKLFDSKDDAEDRCVGDANLFVQDRPAKRNRCLIHKNGHAYCPVAFFCQYNDDYQKVYENAKTL